MCPGASSTRWLRVLRSLCAMGRRTAIESFDIFESERSVSQKVLIPCTRVNAMCVSARTSRHGWKKAREKNHDEPKEIVSAQERDEHILSWAYFAVAVIIHTVCIVASSVRVGILMVVCSCSGAEKSCFSHFSSRKHTNTLRFATAAQICRWMAATTHSGYAKSLKQRQTLQHCKHTQTREQQLMLRNF